MTKRRTSRRTEEAKENQLELWSLYREQLEDLISLSAGIPLQVAAGTLGGKDKLYQIMLHSGYTTLNPEGGLQTLANEFWLKHISTNEQWFDDPIDAARSFIEAWYEFAKSKGWDRRWVSVLPEDSVLYDEDFILSFPYINHRLRTYFAQRRWKLRIYKPIDDEIGQELNALMDAVAKLITESLEAAKGAKEK